MTTKTKVSKSTSHRRKLQEEGFIRVEPMLDTYTDDDLRYLVEEFGYDLNKQELTEGITAVVSHAIHLLISSRFDLKEPKETQQQILLAREIIWKMKSGHSLKTIATKFNSNKKLRYRCPNNLNQNNRWNAKDLAKIAYKYVRDNSYPYLSGQNVDELENDEKKFYEELSKYIRTDKK